MARTKKADQKKDDAKTTTPTPETLEQAPDTAPAPETPEQAPDTAPAPEIPEQAPDAAHTPETPEQAPDATPAPETQGQEDQQDGQSTAQDERSPEGDTDTTEDGDTAQSGKEEPERDLFAGIPNPCVYCGPTVRGVARQYTTYQGGIPDTLRDFIKEHQEARQLIVPTSRFPSMRKRLDTPGTEEAKLYKRVKELL